ncbi:hypothetical protein TELCIR_07871 [Teladorsagia circumcincta]|uniref:DUF1907 domain-containing protein n=1 Tax=Teladorsagia circumcincta TaxID=45464 RepID=A0A2G9UJ66_TELCI|nr:hypothetical protein TELCIR_07871 [Teladorsagia circumcincta]
MVQTIKVPKLHYHQTCCGYKTGSKWPTIPNCLEWAVHLYLFPIFEDGSLPVCTVQRFIASPDATKLSKPLIDTENDVIFASERTSAVAKWSLPVYAILVVVVVEVTAALANASEAAAFGPRRVASFMASKPVIIETHKPSNGELLSVIEEALQANFKVVETKLCQCPDLASEPYNMTSSGFGRKLVIAEIGGPGNLFPVIHREKEFDLKEICDNCEAPSSFVFGPGAGPWKVVGRNCEMVADANFSSSKVATKIASIPPNHSPTAYKMEVIDSRKFSLMANLAISAEPGPAEVVYCKASVRTGKDNFPEVIRKGLAQHYGKKCVSVAGIFVMLKGKAKLHVMPDFPGCNFKSTEEVISCEWSIHIAIRAMEMQVCFSALLVKAALSLNFLFVRFINFSSL